MGNLIKLGLKQLHRENKIKVVNGKLVFDEKELVKRMLKIAKWLQRHNGIAERILKGDIVYQYNNNIKTYARVI